LLTACGGGASETDTPEGGDISPTEAAPASEEAGADTEEAGDTEDAAEAAGEVNLSIWTHDQLYIDYFNSRLEEWEALHPDTTFTYDFVVDSNAPTNALNAIAAGEELPDLVGLEQGFFPNFMKNGIIEQYFVDLTDLVGDRRDDYAEGRFSIYSYKGKLYALESALTASVYYYQPAIYEENGLELPETWEEALVVGEQLAENGSAYSVAGTGASFYEMMLQQRGGNVFNESGDLVLNEEENRAMGIEVADLLQRGVQNGALMVVPDAEMFAGVTIPTAYREGRLAGQVAADWWASCCLKPTVEDMAGQWRVAPPPVWEGGGNDTLVWGGTGFGVTQGPDAEIAKEFLDFMYLSQEGQVARFEQINMFPTMFAAAEDPRVSGLTDPFFSDQEVGAIFASLAPGVPVWYQSPVRADFRTAAADNLQALYDGNITPEAFVDEVIRRTEEAIEFGS